MRGNEENIEAVGETGRRKRGERAGKEKEEGLKKKNSERGRRCKEKTSEEGERGEKILRGGGRRRNHEKERE